jgi:AraC-like DNA-binding protein
MTCHFQPCYGHFAPPAEIALSANPPAGRPALLPARYYALLLELIASQGIDPASLAPGIEPARRADRNAVLSLEQVDALVAGAIAATGRPDLGFQVGRLIKPGNHDFLGYALMTSATLGDALYLAARYWRLITPTYEMRMEPAREGSRIDFRPALAMQPGTARFHLEAVAAGFHEEIGFLLSGRVPRYDIHLPAALADASARYRQLSPARVIFDGMHGLGLQVVLPDDVLARPLALADRNALRTARQRCEEELMRLTTHGSLAQWVALMLDEASDHQPRQQELAGMLHISTRTMNRRLAAEGASYRELGNRARHGRACRMLADSHLPVTRIALQLGYRDTANFSRAFRRQQGQSPLEYRRRCGRVDGEDRTSGH